MNQATQNAEQGAKAFDLIVEGVGYLNRVRVVEVKKGSAYLACTINAMMGLAPEVEYVSIDCRIVGQQAQKAVELLKAAVSDKRKVIVGFRASDPKPEFYEYDDKDGVKQQREGLKARLLQVTFAKIDGVKFEIPLVQRPSQEPQQRDEFEAGSACEDSTVAAA